jgi:hypothetical protein
LASQEGRDSIKFVELYNFCLNTKRILSKLRPRHICEYNIKMYPKEIVHEIVGYFLNMLLKHRIHKRRGIVDCLKDY